MCGRLFNELTAASLSFYRPPGEDSGWQLVRRSYGKDDVASRWRQQQRRWTRSSFVPGGSKNAGLDALLPGTFCRPVSQRASEPARPRKMNYTGTWWCRLLHGSATDRNRENLCTDSDTRRQRSGAPPELFSSRSSYRGLASSSSLSCLDASEWGIERERKREEREKGMAMGKDWLHRIPRTYDERTRCRRVSERRFKEFRLHLERRIPSTSKRMNRDEHFEPLRIRSMRAIGLFHLRHGCTERENFARVLR